jgi:hypothetical protein
MLGHLKTSEPLARFWSNFISGVIIFVIIPHFLERTPTCRNIHFAFWAFRYIFELHPGTKTSSNYQVVRNSCARARSRFLDGQCDSCMYHVTLTLTANLYVAHVFLQAHRDFLIALNFSWTRSNRRMSVYVQSCHTSYGCVRMLKFYHSSIPHRIYVDKDLTRKFFWVQRCFVFRHPLNCQL